MKYRITSDWHIDHWPIDDWSIGVDFIEAFILPREEDDKTTTLLFAGDMCDFTGWISPRNGGKYNVYGRKVAHYLCGRFANVVFAPGNHDYWGADILSLKHRRAMWGMLPDNFLVLDCPLGGTDMSQGKGVYADRYSFSHCGVVGCTLWTNVDVDDDDVMALESFFADFRRTLVNGKELSVDYVRKMHNSHRLNIAKLCDIGGIVMTHHSPSIKQMHPSHGEFSDHIVSSMFHGTDMDLIMELIKPKLWVHGHTHDCMKTVSGDTTIVSNSFGYLYQNYPFECIVGDKFSVTRPNAKKGELYSNGYDPFMSVVV